MSDLMTNGVLPLHTDSQQTFLISTQLNYVNGSLIIYSHREPEMTAGHWSFPNHFLENDQLNLSIAG